MANLKDSVIDGNLIISGNCFANNIEYKTISITWAALKALRDSSTLAPGQQYRITDYICTTSQENTTSAGHLFDIIVTAEDKSHLNEVARACHHSGDTYFTNCDLEAWELKYCLDNDANRFNWANTGSTGRGVIYYMKDEFNNECPYDFKNIQFYRKYKEIRSLWADIGTSADGVAAYTFSSPGNSATTSFTDYSLLQTNYVYSSIIDIYVSNGKQILNNNCFFGNYCYSNKINTNCFENTFGHSCAYNILGDYCYSNIFGNGGAYNTLGSGCFGNGFGSTCTHNILGDACFYDGFGTNCSQNILGGYCNTFTLGSNCTFNKIGNGCYKLEFGDYCSYNVFENNCKRIYIGNYCNENIINNGCEYINFSSKEGGAIGHFFEKNIIDSGVKNIIFYNTSTGSINYTVKNYHICSGVVGSDTSASNRIKINSERALEYTTTVARKSNGNLVQYCEADLIADQS